MAENGMPVMSLVVQAPEVDDELVQVQEELVSRNSEFQLVKVDNIVTSDRDSLVLQGQNQTSCPGAGIDPSSVLERYRHVEGFEGRMNDLIYCQPLSMSALENGFLEDNYSVSDASSQCDTKVVVYFGGDIQDFPEIMDMHRDHRHLTKWSLEATAMILRDQFPLHHIVIVRPSRMQMLTFSCFDNFVPCSNTGVPEHTPNHNALHHFENLLVNLSELVAAGCPKSRKNNTENGLNIFNNGSESSVPIDVVSPVGISPNTSSTIPILNSSINTEEDSFVSSTTTDEGSGVKREIGQLPCTTSTSLMNTKGRVNPHLDRSKITLIGFSKGCVVLNQFLYEFHYLKTLTPDDDSMENFLSRFEHMYWLDGGHNGSKNTWITSRSLLETLKRLGIRIHVHMTPYQLLDDRRPWVRKEEKNFSDSLERFGARISRHVHFDDQPRSLDVHLQVLAEFMTVADTDEDAEDDDDFDDECIEMC